MMGLITIYCALRGFNCVDHLPLLPETDGEYFLRYLSLMLSIVMPVVISVSFALCMLNRVDDSAECHHSARIPKRLV
jgi:hypothetical protein